MRDFAGRIAPKRHGFHKAGAALAAFSLATGFVCAVTLLKPDKTDDTGKTEPVNINQACKSSGINASKDPVKRYEIPPDHFAQVFTDSVDIFRRVEKEKLGNTIPSYIDVEYLVIKSEMESMGGILPYAEGSSYMGLFGVSPTLDAKHSKFAEKQEKIIKVIQSADIPAMEGCREVTYEMLTDNMHFFDPRTQSLIALELAVEGDGELSKLKNFQKMSDEVKRAALYAYHNMPELAKFAIAHLDNKKPVTAVLRDRVHMLSGKIVDRQVTMQRKKEMKAEVALLKLVQRYMEKNPKVYPPKVTAAGIFKNILEKTADALRRYKERDADRYARTAANTDMIKRLLKAQAKKGKAKTGTVVAWE